MKGRIQEQLDYLRRYRIPGLDLGEGFVFPNYQGRSILNLPSSVCRGFGVPELGAQALEPELLEPFLQDVNRIVFILVDGLAWHRLQRWMLDGTAPVWERLADQGSLAPLTSITPSTTSAALTSLWTGRSPAEHAITGYEMWMKEYGVVANTILHAPMNFRNDVGSLEKAGFDPQKALPFTTLGAHLAAHGIPTYALQHRSILNSGLSRMFFQDVKSRGFISAADVWVNLHNLLEKNVGDPLLAYVYWSEVDTLSHHYGPDDIRTATEFSHLSQTFDRLFLQQLSPRAREGTLLVLTADHGQINTQRNPAFELQNLPELWNRLHIQPTGENRLAYLYPRPGQLQAIEDLFNTNWDSQFTLLDPALAVRVGLFGPGTPHPALVDRIGDLVAVAHDDAYLWWSTFENHLRGRHGGLHPEEMLVPLLAIRL